jgi:hypothetical protein
MILRNLLNWFSHRYGSDARDGIAKDYQETEDRKLTFVEKINIQRKAGWRFRKRMNNEGKTEYVIESN